MGHWVQQHHGWMRAKAPTSGTVDVVRSDAVVRDVAIVGATHAHHLSVACRRQANGGVGLRNEGGQWSRVSSYTTTTTTTNSSRNTDSGRENDATHQVHATPHVHVDEHGGAVRQHDRVLVRVTVHAVRAHARHEAV